MEYAIVVLNMAADGKMLVNELYVGMIVSDIALAMSTKMCWLDWESFLLISWNKMASVAMLVGGALVNALAFSGSYYLFSLAHRSGIEEECKHHDKVVEQIQAAQAEWSQKCTERLDWINEELCHQNDSVQTFWDVDSAMHKYYRVTGKPLIH